MLKEKVLEQLKKPDIIKEYGMSVDELQSHFECTISEMKRIIKELRREDLIVAIPFRHAGMWYWRYYSPPHNEIPLLNRIEEIFTALAIPPWVKTRVFRGAQVIFVGEYGKKPGFTIIDYSEEPPLIFRDKLASGNKSEIINYKKRSKYKCEKDGRIKWYNYRGKRIQI